MTEPWAENVLGKMHHKRHEKKKTGRKPRPNSFARDNHRIHVIVGRSFDLQLRQAAKKRGVSMSAYARRAIAQLIARDLELSVKEVLSRAPAPRPMNSAAFYGGEVDNGEGIEDWCPHPGCDGSHLLR